MPSLFLIPKFIKIRKVVCDDCTKSIQFDLQKLTNKKDIEKYLKNNLYVKNYEIRYQIPDIYKIEIQINSPKYAIYNNSITKFYLIDKNGMVIDVVSSTSLPSISITKIDLKNGEKISDQYLFILKILERVNYLYSVKTAILDDNKEFVTFNLPDGIKVFFPTSGDIDYLVGSLRIIYSRLNQEEKDSKINNIREIDLRFKNPVIR